MCSGKRWSVSAGSMQRLGSEHPWGSSEVMRGSQGGGACLEELQDSANVVKATSAAIEHQFTRTPDGFMSLMGRLTAFGSNTTMALVEHGALLGPRHSDMGSRRTHFHRLAT